MKYLSLILATSLAFTACKSSNFHPISASSPESKVRVNFDLDENGRPFYKLYFENALIADTSYLGFELNNAPSLKSNFKLIDKQVSSFDETWEQPWGEQQFIRNNYTQLRVRLQEKDMQKRNLDIVFRIYDNGLGFRYEFPEQEYLRNFEILDELTEFNLTGDHTAWSIPAFEPNRYEYLYRESQVSEMGDVHTPVTMKAGTGKYISIHEAALHDYSSMTIASDEGTRLRCKLVPYSVEEESKVFISAPTTTPWRTIQLADRAGDLITSYLILNLNEPNKLGDVSWITPGKYVGIWWELHLNKGTWWLGPNHGANTENTQKYIDFAAKNGFDGVLVEGWNEGWNPDWATEKGIHFNFTKPYPDFDADALGTYAKEKGVYIVGHHETAGNVNNYESQMNDAFDFLDKHGMKAVKTGYVEHGNLLSDGKYHHGQSYIDHFQKVIQLAAQHKIAVIAHEPIKDTGERRTYPNMLAREGARGQEFNAWSADGGNPPSHTTIIPFTRCLAGPMDFTPGVFELTLPDKPNNRVNTTLAKQLALYVVIYSPMQMACDLPENYEKHPDAFQFIKDVGVDWETTRVIDGEVGDYLIVARKEKGTGHWFVGGITDENARDVQFSLDFLDPAKKYSATIYRDADDADFASNPEAYTIENSKVGRDSKIATSMAPGGGFAISIIDEGPIAENE